VENWIIEEGGTSMKEEGLVYDTEKHGFLHAYSDKGRLIIDQQPCEHEHSAMAVSSA
jgi:hypothetical protein